MQNSQDFLLDRKYHPLPRNVDYGDAHNILFMIQERLKKCRINYNFSGSGEINDGLKARKVDHLRGEIKYMDEKGRPIEVGFEFRGGPFFNEFKFNGMRYDECDDEEVKVHDIVKRSLDDYFKNGFSRRKYLRQPLTSTD